MGDLSASAAAPSVVYVDGVFDLFHPGHVEFLKKARLAGGADARLIVGVITDADARWKREPVWPQAMRAAMVAAAGGAHRILTDPPLTLTDAFIDAHGIDIVVHGDDDYQEDFFRVPRARGIMRYVPYTSGISTSQTIARVLELYRDRPFAASRAVSSSSEEAAD